MRPPLLLYAGVALVPAIAYAILFPIVTTVPYPPPYYTLITILAASAVPGEVARVAWAAAFQTVAFAAGNAYLLRPGSSARASVLWTPTGIVLAAAVIVQVITTPEAWNRQDYAGARPALIAGYVALLPVVVMTWRGMRGENARPEAVLVANCLMHVAALGVLFPYVGELP